MAEIVLETERLILRTIDEGEVDLHMNALNTPAVMEHLGGAVPHSEVQSEVRWLRKQQARDGHTFWLLERKRDAALLGFCGVIRVRERQTPLAGKLEIGWRLRADVWGQSHALEAAQAVIKWAGRNLDAEPIYARIHKDNERSRKLAKRLGMTRIKKLEALREQAEQELHIFGAER